MFAYLSLTDMLIVEYLFLSENQPAISQKLAVGKLQVINKCLIPQRL